MEAINKKTLEIVNIAAQVDSGFEKYSTLLQSAIALDVCSVYKEAGPLIYENRKFIASVRRGPGDYNWDAIKNFNPQSLGLGTDAKIEKVFRDVFELFDRMDNDTRKAVYKIVLALINDIKTIRKSEN